MNCRLVVIVFSKSLLMCLVAPQMLLSAVRILKLVGPVRNIRVTRGKAALRVADELRWLESSQSRKVA